MKIGVGLPAAFPGIKGETVLEWARRADRGPFSTVGLIDRIVYDSHDSLVTLAAVAGATKRVRLMTSVLVAPTRSPVLLAKELATLDSLSGGRLTVGMGVGRREDDYEATGVPFHTRGRAMTAMLATMKRVWNGEPVSDRVGPVGPRPVRAGGPEVLIGARTPPALRRAARYADGFTSTPAPAQTAGDLFRQVREAWKAAGRTGEPRFVGAAYCALGDAGVVERGRAYLLSYYSWAGPGAQATAGGMLTSVDAVRQYVQEYRAAGADEVLLWSAVPDIDQVERLAEAAAKAA